MLYLINSVKVWIMVTNNDSMHTGSSLENWSSTNFPGLRSKRQRSYIPVNHFKWVPILIDTFFHVIIFINLTPFKKLQNSSSQPSLTGSSGIKTCKFKQNVFANIFTKNILTKPWWTEHLLRPTEITKPKHVDHTRKLRSNNDVRGNKSLSLPSQHQIQDHLSTPNI